MLHTHNSCLFASANVQLNNIYFQALKHFRPVNRCVHDAFSVVKRVCRAAGFCRSPTVYTLRLAHELVSVKLLGYSPQILVICAAKQCWLVDYFSTFFLWMGRTHTFILCTARSRLAKKQCFLLSLRDALFTQRAEFHTIWQVNAPKLRK